MLQGETCPPPLSEYTSFWQESLEKIMYVKKNKFPQMN